MRLYLQCVLVCAAGAALTAMVPSASAGRNGATAEYRLMSVDGKALPVLLGTDDGCKEFVTAATLTMADGKWTLKQDERHECPSGNRTESDSESGKYTVEGNTITFMDEEGKRNTGGKPDDDIDLDELDQGTLSGNTLTVRLKEGQSVVFQQ